jgi:hypothetical protein
MRAIVGLFVLLCLVSCSPSRTPLEGTHDSPRAVAQAVLDAVAANDAVALQALALSEQEFRQHVWPELPAARPERNLPFSYVWGDLRQKSAQRLGATLSGHGGRRYTLQDVRFSGETRYAGYTVHRDTALVVQGPDGPEQLRLCGSMIEQDGRWKVFSYVVDD